MSPHWPSLHNLLTRKVHASSPPYNVQDTRLLSLSIRVSGNATTRAATEDGKTRITGVTFSMIVLLRALYLQSCTLLVCFPLRLLKLEQKTFTQPELKLRNHKSRWSKILYRTVTITSVLLNPLQVMTWGIHLIQPSSIRDASKRRKWLNT